MRLRPSRRAVARLSLAVAAPLAALVLCETALRAASFGVQPDFVLRDQVNGEAVLRDNPDIGLIWFEPGLARSPVPFRASPQFDGTRIVLLGESAAMGDPAPAFGIAPFLEEVLAARFPDEAFEVINAGMTAIDSSVIVEIARGLAPLKPDYVVVYMGNNEIVGPHGPLREYRRTPRGETWYTRTLLWVRGLRTSQLLRSAYHRLLTRPEPSWKGLELFAEREVNPASPVMQQVHARYRDNIVAIERAIIDAGAVPVFSTMATRPNWPPFAGADDDDLPAAEQLEAEGQWKGAYAIYRKLLERDPLSAEWNFRAGRAMTALGDVAGGLEAYTRSRDLDRLRFRADSTMNRAVEEATGTATLRIDAETGFNQYWAQPDRYFWDHVHLTPEGNFIAATAFARMLEPQLILAGLVAKANYPSFEQTRRRLVYTEWDRLRLARAMHQRMLRPPFSTQSYFEETIGRMTREITDLRDRMSREILEGERDLLIEAGSSKPGDYHLMARLAALHGELGEFEEQHTVLLEMRDRWPHARSIRRLLGLSHVRLGRVDEGLALLEEGELPGVPLAPVIARLEASSVLAEAGEVDAALALVTQALGIAPGYAKSYYNRGVIYGQMENLEMAQRDFEEAARLDPTMGEAFNNLGVIELKRENPEAAEARFREALDAQPLLVSAMRNLSLVRMMNGDWEGAYALSARLSYLDPELKDISRSRTVPVESDTEREAP